MLETSRDFLGEEPEPRRLRHPGRNATNILTAASSSHLCRNIKKAVDQPGDLGRRVLDVLLGALGEGHVGVLVVEAVVLGEDVLLVVTLQRLAQLHIGDGIAFLCAGDLLHFLVETSKFILNIKTWIFG